MKNKKILLLAILVLLLPLMTFAKNKKYDSLNLKETFAAEGIELKNSKYQENKDQITIYMFRGNNCTYCRNFLEYLNSLTEEYGKYFKLVSYEIWSNQNNAILYSNVAEFLDKDNSGVPFIVIGDKVFQGYSEEYNADILQAIKELYSSKNRYDVFKAMENEEKAKYREQFLKFAIFSVISSIIITLVATIGIIKYENNKNKKLKVELEKLEKKIELYKSSDDNRKQ